MVGITQASLSRAESGVHSLRPDIQERIATILGAPRAELFPDADVAKAS